MDRILGRRVGYVTEVTEWDPPRRSGARTISGPMRVESLARYERLGSATRVTHAADVEDMATLLGRLVQPLFLRMAAGQLRDSLESLKRVLEAG